MMDPRLRDVFLVAQARTKRHENFPQVFCVFAELKN